MDIDATCQAFFDEYVATHGVAPGRNEMVRLLTNTDVPAKRVQKSWRLLMNRAPGVSTDNHQQKESPMQTFPTHDDEPSTDTQVTALAMALAQLSREHKALAGELKDVVQHLGILVADVTLLRQQVQELREGKQFLEKALGELGAALEPYELVRLGLKSNAVAQEQLQGIIRTHDSWTTDKALHNVVAPLTGWPVKTPLV